MRRPSDLGESAEEHFPRQPFADVPDDVVELVWRMLIGTVNAEDTQAGYGLGLLKRLLDAFPGNPLGHQALAVGAGQAIFAGPDYARSAVCTVTGAAIRFTFAPDTMPAAGGPGQLYGPGEHFVVTGRASLDGFSATRDGVTSATLEIDYFG